MKNLIMSLGVMALLPALASAETEIENTEKVESHRTKIEANEGGHIKERNSATVTREAEVNSNRGSSSYDATESVTAEETDLDGSSHSELKHKSSRTKLSQDADGDVSVEKSSGVRKEHRSVEID